MLDLRPLCVGFAVDEVVVGLIFFAIISVLPIQFHLTIVPH